MREVAGKDPSDLPLPVRRTSHHWFRTLQVIFDGFFLSDLNVKV